jgi:hypothetical protein
MFTAYTVYIYHICCLCICIGKYATSFQHRRPIEQFYGKNLVLQIPHKDDYHNPEVLVLHQVYFEGYLHANICDVELRCECADQYNTFVHHMLLHC